MNINGEHIAKAVQLVRDYRKAVGLEDIEDLPKGVRQDTRHCIFAKAFNFDCRVYPGMHKVYFSGDNYMDNSQKLADLLGTSVVFDNFDDDHYSVVQLPEYICEIAIAFDRGMLPQYVE